MSHTESPFLRAIAFGTAALAAAAVVKTLWRQHHTRSTNVEQVDAVGQEERRSASSKRCGGGCQCASNSAPSSSSSAYTTAGSDPASNPYETQASVHEYLLMHFGGARELLNFPALQGAQMADATAFPKLCADICAEHLKSVSRFAAMDAKDLRALDIGCAVGRSSFELTRHFGTVIGLDYSNAFIDAANQLKKDGEMAYDMRVEGDLKQHAVARVDPALDRSRVRFVQGDACDLSLSALGGARFHVLLAANLLCRLPFPRRFLSALPSLVERDGFVVLPSPYTWLDQYTPRSEWVGGYVDAASGKEVRSADALKELMEQQGFFKLVAQRDVPFFIRETARKNQWSVSHCTVWQRTNKD